MPAKRALLNGRVTASTRLAAVIGSPVRHSLSPIIHNAAFAELGLDWVYVAVEIAAGQGAAGMAAAALMGFDGLSVTMPLKEEACVAAAQTSAAVDRLGAANCLVRIGDGWSAHNTDGVGFVADLLDVHGFDPAGRRAVVVGAGGAARSVIDALVGAGCSAGVLARRDAAAVAAVASVASDGRRGDAHVATLDDVSDADLVVNATPLGMADHPGLPVPPEEVGHDALAIDLVYHPTETAWLRALRRRGVAAHNGIGMLVAQAAAQFELWTGERAPVEVMRRVASDAVG